MAPEKLQERIDELFDKATSLPVEKRSAFLDEECQDDPTEVRREVEGLLRAGAATPLVRPVPLPGFEQGSQVQPRDRMIGQQVGVHIIRKRIGRGAFGTVYVAERAGDYRQKVAIKLIRSDLVDDEEVLARFKLERDALAALQHENIARLLDGGSTDEGMPYFVMEYIEGKPITEYCDAERLSINDRLILFRQVCAAVQFTHEFGYIHRDIKPTNILVTDSGVPKLLDFGIAKLIDRRSLTVEVPITEIGVPGTPEYCSPEQAAGDSTKANSIGTDVYALGVVLYRLLTGHHPYEFKEFVLDEIKRAIREEEPVKPCAVIFKPVEEGWESSTSKPRPEQVSSRRKTTPARLQRMIKGDLETVCLKCLEKDPSHRYASPLGLAEDLDRFLKGIPTLARPVSRTARAWRWCKRKPVAAALVITASLLTFVLGVGGPLVAIQQSDFARKQLQLRKQEQEARERAEWQLCRLHWRSGVTARDGEGHAIRATHHFLHAARAAAAAKRGGVAENAVAAAAVASRLIDRSFVHDEAVRGAILNHQNTRVLTWSSDDTARLWDIQTGDPIRTFRHAAPVMGASFSNDESRVLTWSLDGSAKLWNVQDVSAQKTFAHGGGVYGAVFDKDESRLLTWGSNNKIKLWNAADGRQIREFVESTQVERVVFSKDESQLLSITNGGPATVWDAEAEGIGHSFSDAVIGGMFISNDTEVLVWNGWGSAEIYSLTTGDRRKAFTHERFSEAPGTPPNVIPTIDGAVLLKNNSQLLTWSSGDNTARLWDVRSGKMLRRITQELRGRRLPMRGIDVSEDESRLLTWGPERIVFLWNTRPKRILGLWNAQKSTPLRVFPHSSKVAGARFSPGDNGVLVWGEHGAARLWGVDAGVPRNTFVHQGKIRGTEFLDEGSRILTWGDDGTARLWNIARNGLAVVFHHKGPVNGASFSRDQSHVLTWSGDGSARLWQTRDGELKRSFEHSQAIRDAFFCDDESRVVTVGTGSGLVENGGVRLWNGETGRLVQEFSHQGQVQVQGAVMTQDASQLFTRGYGLFGKARPSGRATQWDVSTGKPISVFDNGPQPISHLILFTNGTKMITAGWHGRIHVWDVSTREKIHRRVHGSPVSSMLLTSDQSRVLTAGSMCARLWEVESGRTIRSFKHDSATNGATLIANEERVVTWDLNGRVKVWDISTDNAISSFTHVGAIRHVSFNHTDSLCLTCGDDGEARLWELSTGACLQTFRHREKVNGGLISKDEARVLSWDDEGLTALWDVATGERIVSVRQAYGVNGVLWSNDESHFVVWGQGKTASLWNVGREHPADVELQTLEFQVRTGTSLDESGQVFETLSHAKWRERKRRFDDLQNQ